MQNPPPVQTAKSSTGLDENVAALLSYVLNWVSGLVFFLIEKTSRLVRFHAMQSILLTAVGVVLFFVLWIFWFIGLFVTSQLPGMLASLLGLLLTLIWVVFWVGLTIAWVMCLVKAYQGKYFKLPIIGNLAEKFSTK
jgi:uncharacterized membrane protein